MLSTPYKRIASRFNLESSIFSGHSARVGAAQEMVENDIDLAKIMLSGRWSDARILVRYAQKMSSKKGGMTDLSRKLHWDTVPSLEKDVLSDQKEPKLTSIGSLLPE